MSALMNTIGLSDDNTSVTKISANARIDYILRFSKQAILVVDESVEQNAQITNQFIATIPEQHNIAFIALSAQFNDIQIRCRIIEQLSAGELFDPEVSLAVSIINLAKKPRQAISIVLDNAQHISLQILHEVTQLTAIAKKANLVVNVIMFGSPQAGFQVQDNKNLFHNKLTLLSAQSGQLLAANAAIFNKPEIKWYTIQLNKWLLLALVFLFALGALVLVLLQQDSFNFTTALKSSNKPETALSTALTAPQATVLTKVENAAVKSAEPADIYTSLTATKSDEIATVTRELVEPATANDIMLAMTSFTMTAESAKNDAVASLNLSEKQPQTSIIQPLISANVQDDNVLKVDTSYYLEQGHGFVIQIAAFSDVTLPAEFIASLADVDYHVYQRMLNDTPVFVITSRVFSDKASAKQGILTLPAEIIASQPWIKSLQQINSEINAFQDSQ